MVLQRTATAEAVSPSAITPRYFFDTHDGGHHIDNVGTECPDAASACIEAMHALPEIAKFAIPEDGDQQRFVVLVRDEGGAVIYTATLTFAGLMPTGAMPTAT